MSKPPAWFASLYLEYACGIPLWWQWTWWLANALKAQPQIADRIDQGYGAGEGAL